MHLFGFSIRIYHDARSPERQMRHIITTNHEQYNFLFQQFHTSALELSILLIMGLCVVQERKLDKDLQTGTVSAVVIK